MSQPPLARETPRGREYYNFKTQEVAISVTTALKSFHKKEIEDWKFGMAAKLDNWDEMATWHPSVRKDALIAASEDYTEERAAVGTIVHETVESIIKGVPVEVPKEAASYIGQFGKFVMDKRPEFIHSEVTVWSRSLGYAGTADIIMKIGGQTILADIKSGKNAHPENGMQVAALKYADFIIDPDCSEHEIPQIDQLAVLHLRPRGYRLIPIRREIDCFKAFCGALELARWKDEVADHVLGEAALWHWFPWPWNAPPARVPASGRSGQPTGTRTGPSRCT